MRFGRSGGQTPRRLEPLQPRRKALVSAGDKRPEKRSNCHVDAECGFPRHPADAAKTQGVAAHSRRRGLAVHRPHAQHPRRPQGRSRADVRQIRPGLSQPRARRNQHHRCSGPRPTNWCCSTSTSCSPRPMAGRSMLGRLFPRGLMLLDFEEHRLHRRALSVAFKSGPMKSYLAALDAGIAARVAQWKAAARPDAVLSGDEAADARPCRDLVSRRRHRSRSRRDHARLCRHGGGRGDADPLSLCRSRRWRAASRAASASSPISPSRFRSAATRAARICSRSSATPPMRTARCSRPRTSSIT